MILQKIILFSDLHRGVGDWSDDFAHNKQIFLYALQHYFDPGYTYIEIGGELWENKDFEGVKRTYSNVFELMTRFYKEKREKRKDYIRFGEIITDTGKKTKMYESISECSLAVLNSLMVLKRLTKE